MKIHCILKNRSMYRRDAATVAAPYSCTEIVLAAWFRAGCYTGNVGPRKSFKGTGYSTRGTVLLNFFVLKFIQLQSGDNIFLSEKEGCLLSGLL